MLTIIGGDGKPYGPVAIDQVRRWLSEGRATLDTQVQRAGEETWQRLGDLREFSANPVAPFVPPEPAASTQSTSSASTPFEIRDENENVLAGRLVRLVAYVIDTFLSMVFAMPGLVMIALKLISEGNLEQLDPEQIELSQLGNGVFLMIGGLLVLGIIQMWILTVRGQTIGKRLLGIEIVRCDSEEKPGFSRAVFLRMIVPGLIGSISWMALGIIFTLVDICFIFRQDRRCIHDHIAGTKVIEYREKKA